MTKGTGRTLLDVALYAALLATIFGTLFADGTGRCRSWAPTSAAARVAVVLILVLLGFWVADKVIFLAAAARSMRR